MLRDLRRLLYTPLSNIFCFKYAKFRGIYRLICKGKGKGGPASTIGIATDYGLDGP